MADTVLTIIQNHCKKVGIPAPAILVSSGDKQVIQLQALLDEVGQDLVTRFKFQELMRYVTFPAIASENQGPIETLLGFEPEMIESGTFWNVSTGQPMYGPMDDTTFSMTKAMLPAGPPGEYRIMNNELLILPAPTAGHTISVMLRLKTWLIGSSPALLKQAITADDDQPVLDDKMIALGLTARWKEEKGLPYAEAARRYESMAVSKAAKSGTKPTLYLDEPCREVRPGIWVPAGSWPV